jgi:TetR/AcrR family transcriptional regulator
MPLQRYEQEQILDSCLEVFALHGYDKTSTRMLAEAAGISKALIFHHFKSKKELYLQLLDQCSAKARAALEIDKIPDFEDFFEARERYAMMKFNYFKQHPHVYKVMKEAFYETPVELTEEINERYGDILAKRNNLWRTLFDRVPLKEGIRREEAYTLFEITLHYFEEKYLSEIMDENEWDETIALRFMEERNRFMRMIRYGIER